MIYISDIDSHKYIAFITHTGKTGLKFDNIRKRASLRILELTFCKT